MAERTGNGVVYGPRLASLSTAFILALALSACAVGPDFKRPTAPQTAGYTPGAAPTQTTSLDAPGGQPQRFQQGQDMGGQWWTLFRSPRLDALMAAALTRYPDLQAQQAALRAARESLRAGQGVFLPQVQGQGGATREQVLGGTAVAGAPGFITDIYQANVGVSYALDLFGGERRQVEGLKAAAEAQRFALEASYLTLTANVAATAIQAASARDQIAATQEIVASEEKQLALIQRQYELGGRTRAEILQQQSDLALVRATLPPLRQQLDMAEHQLAILTGRFPHDAAPTALALSDLALPQDLPVTLPSALVEQRPDIRQQEALLHQASAQVGVATANLLPKITLGAVYGQEAFDATKLLAPGAQVWSLTGGITQPIFQGGTLLAQRRGAIDLYDQAEARYRLTVLQAFQNVADCLTALGHDAEAYQAANDAEVSAKASLDLVQRQYDDGAAAFADLFTAQQTWQRARIGSVRALAARYADTVSLFQALGGGWQGRQDVAMAKSSENGVKSPLASRQ